MSIWPSQWIAISAIAKIARKKDFRSFNGIRTRGLCVSAAVLSQLSYEDPYTGGWPIYWVHQPVKGMKHWKKWCELREYKWNEYMTIAVNRTAMVIYCDGHILISFVYSRSSHHFFQWLIFCFITLRTLLTVSAVEFSDSGNSTRTVTAVHLIFNLSRRERTPGNYRALTTLLYSYAY